MREWQYVRGTVLGYAVFGRESGPAVRQAEPFRHLGRRRERRDLDTAEVDHTLLTSGKLSAVAGVAVTIVMLRGGACVGMRG